MLSWLPERYCPSFVQVSEADLFSDNWTIYGVAPVLKFSQKPDLELIRKTLPEVKVQQIFKGLAMEVVTNNRPGFSSQLTANFFARRTGSAIAWNTIWVSSVISVFGVFAFSVHPGDIGERLGLIATSLLAVMALKTSVSLGEAPKIGYTLLDQKLLFEINFLFLLGVYFSAWSWIYKDQIVEDYLIPELWESEFREFVLSIIILLVGEAFFFLLWFHKAEHCPFISPDAIEEEERREREQKIKEMDKWATINGASFANAIHAGDSPDSGESHRSKAPLLHVQQPTPTYRVELGKVNLEPLTRPDIKVEEQAPVAEKE